MRKSIIISVFILLESEIDAYCHEFKKHKNIQVGRITAANFKELKEIYENEFVRMTTQEITLEELLETRKQLLKVIHETITSDEKQFLLGFKSMKPEWTLLGLNNGEAISQLPSVRWRIINLKKLSGKKHGDALSKLKEILKID